MLAIDWYRAHQNLDALNEMKRDSAIKYIHIVNDFVGFYADNPRYEEVVKFDLRFEVTGTFDDLCSKYF
jgi:hypothetical protein